MKLTFVCSEYPPGPHGGIGSFTQTMARALVRQGHEVRVVGVYGPAYAGPEEFQDQGVRVRRLNKAPSRYGWIAERYALFRTVRRWIREEAVDLVEAPDFEGVIAGWPDLGVPVVARYHGSATYYARELCEPVRRSTYLLERASLQRADFRCAVSRYTAGRTSDAFPRLPEVDAILHNAVPPVRFSPFEERTSQRVLFSGSLVPKKGVLALARAWRVVAAEMPTAELHLYGKDVRQPDGCMMTDQLREVLGPASASVHFHGHVSREELLDALSTARAAVFPSYGEAFGLAPVEAMSTGCPTIFTRLGAGPEVIESERDGLLVDPDVPSDIAHAILRLLQDDDLAGTLGRAGYDRVQRSFTLETAIPENERFYSACIEAYAQRVK